MNKSPIFSRYETSDYCSYEFDYQADFTQFLEEARKNAPLGLSNTSSLQAPDENQLDKEKKNRKTWKHSLFAWLKTDKKAKSINQPAKSTSVAKPRRGHASGPLRGGSGIVTGRNRPVSGPLSAIFSSAKRVEEYEVPYMCLTQFNPPDQKLHSYGPVYLVT